MYRIVDCFFHFFKTVVNSTLIYLNIRLFPAKIYSKFTVFGVWMEIYGNIRSLDLAFILFLKFVNTLSVLSGVKWLHKFGCYRKMFYHDLSCTLYGFLRILPTVNYCTCVPHCRLFLSSCQYNRVLYSNLCTFVFFIILYNFRLLP